MSNQHTPGEWFVEGYGAIGSIVDEAGDAIAQAQQRRPSSKGGPDTERLANTAFIAAAPALYKELAHLVFLLEPLEQTGTLKVPGLATLNGARAALAKANGAGS